MFKMLFASSLSSELNDLDFNSEVHPIESTINFDTFIQQMSYDDNIITARKNCQLKSMFNFNTNSQI